MTPTTSARSQLARLAPHGLVVTKTWLMEQGLARHGIDNLVKSGQLMTLRPGVFKRPETSLAWQGVVCSLQRMHGDLVVGGLSALELHGFAHYLPLLAKRTIHLYGRAALPAWVNQTGVADRFIRHGTARLWRDDAEAGRFAVDLPWGDQSRTMRVSTPERALFELLASVPVDVTFDHADKLMQGLATLSPRRLEKLLRQTPNVKAKRLFFWLAERHGHAWMGKLNPDDFDLGRGKRVLAKGGKLEKKYLITVPEELHGPE